MGAKSLSLALAFAALASSCASNPNVAAKVPNTSIGCSSTLAQLHPVPLAFSARIKAGEMPAFVEFADISSCLAPEGDKPRAVVLYQLENSPLPLELEIKIQLAKGGTMAASVELLDASFQMLRRYGFGTFIRRGDEYTLPLFLNGQDSAVRYAVITPDSDSVGKEDAASGSEGGVVPIAAGGLIFMLNEGHEVKVSYPFTAGGRIAITLVTGAPSQIVAPAR